MFKSPEHLVLSWPEVFKKIYLESNSLRYIESIKIEFFDGGLWQLDANDYSTFDSDKILNLLKEYETKIFNLDIKIDLEKIKSDIRS